MKYLIFILITATSAVGFSAPIPGTSSSALITESLGIYKSEHGFMISSGSSSWKPELLGDTGIFNLVEFSPAATTTDASLTVRVDKLKKHQDLSEYVKSWLKDYGHYGFDVLRVKRVKIQGEVGVVVDLSHPKHEKSLRQVVFLKDQKAVVLTCKDSSQKFSETLPSCNEIIKSFTWAPSMKAQAPKASLAE